MTFDFVQYITLLSSTPPRLQALVEELSDSQFLSFRSAEDQFSITDILGHLIYGEQVDWIPRLDLMLAAHHKKDDLPTFDPFDRYGYQQLLQQHNVAELLVLFATLRQENIEHLRQIEFSNDTLAIEGIHPSLGRVNVTQLLNSWVVHDLSHLNQINRILCHQFAAVGPWKEYLRILRE